MHNARSMFYSPRCIMGASKLCARDEPRNLDSKRYLRFYAMSGEHSDKVSQNT